MTPPHMTNPRTNPRTTTPPMTTPQRRRRRAPIIAVVSVLAVLATITWTTVLVGAGGPAGPQSCPAPAAGVADGASPGESLEAGALDTVAPAPPGQVAVQVFNAGGQRGQANLVAAELGDLGFGAAGAPGNDPFFPSSDMECFGQIRFGTAGEAAASTLALVLPCADLVRDGRTETTVDVSVGTGFADVNPPRPVRDVLESLGAPSPAGDGATDAPTPPDPAVLAQARDTSC